MLKAGTCGWGSNCKGGSEQDEMLEKAGHSYQSSVRIFCCKCVEAKMGI